MTHQIILHPDDIAEIIAEKFKVPPADVSVYTEKTTTGYGLSEREITMVRAKIKIPAERIKPPTRCGGCVLTDGIVYTSNPPKVKCVITGKFHHQTDLCDCEEQRKEG